MCATLSTQLPGPGSIPLDQSLRFITPLRVGDTLSVTLRVMEKLALDRLLVVDCQGIDQDGQTILQGTVRVRPPERKIRTEQEDTAHISVSDKPARLRSILEKAKDLPPIQMAVVHPCDGESLKGALMAAQAGLIHPILIGPEEKIRTVARENAFNLAPYRIVPAKNGREAAAMAITLIRNGDAEAIMKGQIHTDELMAEVVSRTTGLRTPGRISHVFLIDVPTYPRQFMITDAAINIAPTLEEKAHIVQNAIDLAHILGVTQPRVALLSAVETVNPKMPSTLDAAALCKMADRGQIKGGILDGPLAFDNAVSDRAAKAKGIESDVAGCADILVVPDLESGNMLAKQLEYLADAITVGIVLGAKVPIVLTSRADTAETRMASCVIAALIAHSNRRKAQEK